MVRFLFFGLAFAACPSSHAAEFYLVASDNIQAKIDDPGTNDGDTIYLVGAGFKQTFDVSKSLTIKGLAGARIDLSGTDTATTTTRESVAHWHRGIVKITHDDVRLENLAIIGGGNGSNQSAWTGIFISTHLRL